MSNFFTYNNKIYPGGTAILTPDCRGLRYGDGLFETMKVSSGIILLKEQHFDRLFRGLRILKFSIPQQFNREFLEKEILNLCKRNRLQGVIRARLSIFRGEGGLFDPINHFPNYLIEVWPLQDEGLNINGLVIDYYPDIKKSCDIFANVKNNNFLPYVMAGLFVEEHKLNEALILNQFNRICDSTISNVFMIKGEKIYTPPLSEGCIEGVMRRWLLEVLPGWGYIVEEKPISVEDLHEADEIFLSNVIRGIRWVGNFGDTLYAHLIISRIYAQMIQLSDKVNL